MKFKVSLVCFVFCIVVWNQICDAKRYGGGGSLSRGSNRGSSRRTGELKSHYCVCFTEDKYFIDQHYCLSSLFKTD